jgi:hypothetical protein
MMIWKNFWEYLKSIWGKICNQKTSSKSNSLLDTASLKVFGLDIKVTRELPAGGPPYELTVVVPRAELRMNKKNGNQEIILSSITIAHSPRFEKESEPKKPLTTKIIAA